MTMGQTELQSISEPKIKMSNLIFTIIHNNHQFNITRPFISVPRAFNHVVIVTVVGGGAGSRIRRHLALRRVLGGGFCGVRGRCGVQGVGDVTFGSKISFFHHFWIHTTVFKIWFKTRIPRMELMPTAFE